MRHIIQIVVAAALLGGGFIAFNTLKGCEKKFLGKTKDQPGAKGGKGRRNMPKIKTRVTELKKQDYTVNIHSQGEIRAHHTTSLTPQVGGRVVKISPKFEDGAFFREGDVLLQIEKSDFLTEIASARAQLARAEAAYAQEQARARQALLNWKDAGFDEEPTDLVLRKPQLREAEANVNSARSSLERAERNLARTAVRAPYNGRVRSRTAGIGQQVGPGTSLGEIFTTDVAEVRLPLTPRDLQYYRPPSHATAGSGTTTATLTSIVTTDAEDSPWQATVTRTEGELDADSRQIFIIARIDDPFGLESGHPPLYLGQPVRATIPAKVLKGVYVVPRDTLSDLNEIILIRDGKIHHLKISPLWSTGSEIIIREGVRPGDRLAVTRMPFAPEGAPVEIIPETAAAGE